MGGPFGILWAGQTVSVLGDAVFLVALTWQLAVQWHQPGLLGTLLAVRVAAELATLLLGGWIVDRLPRRNLVAATDTVRALVLAGMALLLHRPAPVIPLAALMVMFGAATALFRPALAAYIPEVAPQGRLQAANAWFGLSTRVALTMAGPALGAWLVGVGSAPTALRLDAATFVLSAATMLALPARRPEPSRGGPFAQTLEGLRTVRLATWTGGGIHSRPGQPGHRRRGADRAAAGRRRPVRKARRVRRHPGRRRRRRGRHQPAHEPPAGARTAWPARLRRDLAFGLSTATLGLGHGVALGVAVGVLFGVGQELFDLLWVTGLQRLVPDRLLGRVFAVDHLGSYLLLPLSFGLGGLVVQAASPTLVLTAAGLAAATAGTLGLTVPALHRWRHLDDPRVPLAVQRQGCQDSQTVR
jgi:MFS family permease